MRCLAILLTNFVLCWCLAMKTTSDHENNVSIGFLMSENIQFDTKIVFISAILVKIWIFSFFAYREKGGVPGTIKINDFQKTPKGASLAPSGFGFYNVWWYQIHRDPSWDLYCKVVSHFHRTMQEFRDRPETGSPWITRLWTLLSQHSSFLATS